MWFEVYVWTPWLMLQPQILTVDGREIKHGSGRSRSAACSPCWGLPICTHVPLNASIPRPFTLLDLLLSCPDLGRACHSPYLVANLSALWERAWNISGLILGTRKAQVVEHSPFPHVKHQTSSQISTWIRIFLCRFYNSNLKLIIHSLTLFFFFLSFWSQLNFWWSFLTVMVPSSGPGRR